MELCTLSAYSHWNIAVIDAQAQSSQTGQERCLVFLTCGQISRCSEGIQFSR